MASQPLWPVGVAIILWVASRIYELNADVRRSRSELESFLRGLYAEIDFNTADLEIFLHSPIGLEVFREKLESKNFTPHVTDARHTDIYRKNLHRLDHIKDGLIHDIVSFYGSLDKIKTQIDGLSKGSFKSISVNGQVNVIDRIYREALVAKEIGLEIMDKMGSKHPSLALKRRPARFDDRGASSDFELSQRLQMLASNLERIRTRHEGSSRDGSD